jgi:hypothetical protein
MLGQKSQNPRSGNLREKVSDVGPGIIPVTCFNSITQSGDGVLPTSFLDSTEAKGVLEGCQDSRDLLEDVEDCTLNDPILDRSDYERARSFSLTLLQDALLRDELKLFPEELTIDATDLLRSRGIKLLDRLPGLR